jgi:hypothetical protein
MGKKQKRKKRNNHTNSTGDFKRLFKVLGLSLLIVMLFLAAILFISRYTDLDLFGKNESPADIADGLIFKIDTDNVRSVKPYGNGVAMLTNASVLYLDSAGRQIESNKHIYAAPEMQINDKTVFVYDKGGTNCRIEKNASVYRELTAPGVITCGAVGRRDNYAYSVDNHDGYQSHIFVYNFKGEKQFEWGSASDYCFRLALSDLGNRIAVCVVGVQNAEYYSKVMLFSFNSGQPNYTVDFSGKTVFDIDFVSGKKLAVYTDEGVYLIDPDGTLTAQQEYTASEIEHTCVNTHGLSCTAVIPYGNEQTPLITVFDGLHKPIYSHQYNTLISGVVCSGSYVGVVMFDKVQILNRSNRIVGDIHPGEACERCVIVNNYLFVLTGTGLHRYHLRFDSDKAETTEGYVPQVVRNNPQTTEPQSVSDTDASPAEPSSAESASVGISPSNSLSDDGTIAEDSIDHVGEYDSEDDHYDISEDEESDEPLFG